MSDTVSDHSADHQHSALQTYYSEYLINVKHTTRSTVGHYRGALDRISEMLREKNLVQNSIYEINNIEKLFELRQIIELDPQFIEMNRRGNRMYRAALNNYCQFASGDAFENIRDDIEKLDTPQPKAVNRLEWGRSDILRRQVIASADYLCDIDHSHESFISERTNEPYMEGHHAIPLRNQKNFEYSLDVYANIVCLCPICHRKIHYGLVIEREKMIHQIYFERIGRLRNSGIDVDMEKFTDLAMTSR